ncbi:MAG: AraC family transcriptional regulator [Eubacteriales bacterium]|nr:AraC family transcriptional regulator [Eubacteriales bacterium]
MEIQINDYNEPEHFRALNEDQYNLSRSCEYEFNEMHHMHEATEILLIECGSADYFVDGQKYSVEAGDILVIGSRCHHMRRLRELPFQRYGVTIKPSYCSSLKLDGDLSGIFQTPSLQEFETRFKRVDRGVFDEIIHLVNYLYGERETERPYRALLERSILTEIAVLLYRQSGRKGGERPLSAMQEQMAEVRAYIDSHYREPLSLQELSERFFLHPVTISKEFRRCFGQNLMHYLHNVRICEAVRLLENTQDSVTVIAGQVGYENVNTFLRQFRGFMETTPQQYRRNIRAFYGRRQTKEPLISSSIP